jgi:hypothetical protein
MTLPLRPHRARSALTTPPQGDAARRRSRLLIVVSAVSATFLMLMATVGPASASFEGGRWQWRDGQPGLLYIPYVNEIPGCQ